MGTTTVDPVEFGTKTEIKCSHLIGTEILNTLHDVGSFTAMARQCTWPSSDITMVDIRHGIALTSRHRASSVLGQAFHYSPENAFYIFNQQIYFIILYLFDRASLI